MPDLDWMPVSYRRGIFWTGRVLGGATVAESSTFGIMLGQVTVITRQAGTG